MTSSVNQRFSNSMEFLLELEKLLIRSKEGDIEAYIKIQSIDINLLKKYEKIISQLSWSLKFTALMENWSISQIESNLLNLKE